MVGKTPRVLKDERQRLDVIKSHCGCLCCLLMGHLDRLCTIEHVTENGRRVGSGSSQHENTVGMCVWHHFGACDSGRTRQMMIGEFGPSLAHGRKPFEEHFGDEVDVLISVQNFVLEAFAVDPWPEYNLPGRVARLTRNEWIELNAANDTSRYNEQCESN